ncbi:transketolase [Pelagibacterales bacterium SAG-MED43]|nr:transketolase [Pelagibacterales bacterium SAG-MED43]
MNKQHNNLANCIRFLSIDAVQKANSGHPGMPMGMADVVTVLFKNFLKFNPRNPDWLNRDRFILSAGHGSMLLYSLLYLTGYKSISLKNIKEFRQLKSICAGHPEFHPKSGIETTTGPLGQGIGNAVGLAIAESILEKKIGSNLFNHKTYVLAGDGCLMEGISHEAMSLAGHLKLKNLVMLFDNNSVSIDGPTSLAVSDNFKKRFESYGWNYLNINGHNTDEIFKALQKVQNAKKPTVISCKTKIGFGSPNKSGKSSSHGSPLGFDEIELVRKKLKWRYKPFEIPKNLLKEWRKIGEKGLSLEKKWNKIYHKNKYKINELFNQDFSKELKSEKIESIKELSPLATRKASEKTLIRLTKKVNALIGGSADLAGSNNTKTKSHKILEPGKFKGNYIHYGVREHAMGAIMNGLKLHSKFIPYGGTFLIFSDYCKPAIRLSALMELQIIYIMTHDSIGLGEDGPTHQPVEQLSGLRAIPNLNVLRPADRMETIECWEIALKSKNTPSILSLTRQNLKPIRKKYSNINMCSFGAYEVLRTGKKIDLTILASGSEVNLAVETSHKLAKDRIYSKVISMPCFNLFDNQTKNFRDKILRETKNIISIEAASTDCWKKYIGINGLSFGIDTFGKSAPYKDIYKHFGLTVQNIVNKSKKSI